MEKLFRSIFETTELSKNGVDFLLCAGVAIGIGVFLSLIYRYKNHYTKSFIINIIILPAIVALIIMMVNGNLGTGVAVAGAFSLIRFRSQPGRAKDIAFIFIAMACGLCLGMGYVGYAVVFALIIGMVVFLVDRIKFFDEEKSKTLRIVVPEDLNFEGIFDELLQEYTKKYELVNVKTSNLGSLFKLSYDVILKANINQKEMIDKLRCLNGNLEITIMVKETNYMEL